MNILLTGASGQLGQELTPRLQALGDVTRVDRAAAPDDRTIVKQDLSDLNRLEILLNRLAPDLLVNAAAYTAVDRAESDHQTAFRLNADLPGCMARWAARHGRLLLHYSTDYVFSGEAGRPYTEADPTEPLNSYGDSKRAGEWQIDASGCQHVILRTSWVYSGHGNNFVLTMLRLARERPQLSIVSDQVGCPTWARNLARASVHVVHAVRAGGTASGASGLWHYCDSGVVSWYDFAQAIFAAGLSAGLLERLPEVRAVRSEDFPQEAERPRYSVLDTTAIQRDFGIEPAALEPSLRSCIEELKKND